MCQNPGVHHHGAHKALRGFTLIEILVSISIIALLIGIGVVVGSSAQKSARRAQVHAIFESLKGANTEFQAQLGTYINHDGGTVNWSAVPGGTGFTSSERFVYACRLTPESEKNLLAALKSGTEQANKSIFNDKDGDGTEEIYDPWGKQIVYRLSNDQSGSQDGVSNSDLPISRDPFFISAGPDETFGTDDDIASIEIES